MTGVLGYERYATYGEDVGTWVSDRLAATHPDAVLGLFATHAAFPPPERRHDLTPQEQDFLDWLDAKWKRGSAYSSQQSTRQDVRTPTSGSGTTFRLAATSRPSSHPTLVAADMATFFEPLR